MEFFKHYDIEGKHAFLGASKWHWIHYDTDHLIRSYFGWMAAQKGTVLHAFAAECIRLGQKLPRSKKTLNMYVNDAIGFGLTPEQPLWYSENCFGTADAVGFRDKFLRIHDYKSGEIKAHMEQLLIYSALFCLNYGEDPKKIRMETRIYQNDEVDIYEPSPDEIQDIMNKIQEFDQVIKRIKLEEG